MGPFTDISTADFIPIARISRLKRNNLYKITYRGNALEILSFPLDVYLYYPKESFGRNLNAPSFRGLPENADLIPAKLLRFLFKNGIGEANLEIYDSYESDNLPGSWICVNKSLLRAEKVPYRFELLGADVSDYRQDAKKIGMISDVFETGAGFVIIVKTEDGKEAFIPFQDEFARWDGKKLIISELEAFIQ